ncbi:Peptidyl-prolyl cis-trans isomerase D [invertebrate metagenome]|uniref:Periplasmic chaperone PpiD n=1 Tax=invertebrate metagenome TaxID=1711999 RepID=A0A2H9T813_9ZZZZ
MLQSMREKARSWVTIVVVAVIAFMMAITGLESLSPSSGNKKVATVNGQDITERELLHAQEQQKRMLVQQMGEQFDPSMIDEKLLQDAVLNSLVDRLVQLQDAADNKMEISNDMLDTMIVSMPEFQQDGRFNQDRFRMLVRNIGMSPAQFRQMLKEESLLMQLRAGWTSSEFVTKAEMNTIHELENQKRDIGWTILPLASVEATIHLSEESIQAYYKDHENQFMTPEEVVISYLVLDRKKLAETVSVDEISIENEYQRRVESLKAKISPRVSTIIIAVNDKQNLESAEQKASEAVKQLNEGKSFSHVVAQYSDDKLSAKKGGDLGYVKPGFFGDRFDEVVASLKVGEMSDPIETRNGIQILTVTDRKIPDIPSLERLRKDIVAVLQDARAEGLYLEKSRELADISFEAADLAQPAEQMKLSLQESQAFSRNGGEGILSDRKIIEAAFSDDVLSLGANSDVIEIAPGKSVVLRIKQHNPSKQQTLEIVHNDISLQLKRKEGQKMLQDKAQGLVSRLQKGISGNLEWEKKKSAGRREEGVPREVIQAAFKMARPEENKMNYDTVTLSGGDMAIVSLNAVVDGGITDKSGEQNQMLSQYFANNKGRLVYSEYLQSLKAQADIEKKLTDTDGQ